MLTDRRTMPARSMTKLQSRSVQGRTPAKKRAAQGQQIYGAVSLAYLFAGRVDRYSPQRHLTRGCKRPSRVEVRIVNQRQLYLFENCVGKLPEIGCGLRDRRATGQGASSPWRMSQLARLYDP